MVKVIIRLVRNLDVIKVPAARATIIWLVGEYCSIGERIPWMLTSVLKYLACCFTSEASETKLQILNTATKVLLIGRPFFLFFLGFLSLLKRKNYS